MTLSILQYCDRVHIVERRSHNYCDLGRLHINNLDDQGQRHSFSLHGPCCHQSTALMSEQSSTFQIQIKHNIRPHGPHRTTKTMGLTCCRVYWNSAFAGVQIQ